MADVEANLRAKVTVDGAKQGTVELNNLANAGDKAGKKLNLMDKFVNLANKTISNLVVGVEDLNLSYEKGDITLDSYNKKTNQLINTMSRLQKIARGTSESFTQFGKTQQTYAQIAGSNTREAAQANRFNTGNIAAQFQDIAVTSAMNMNPLTIGLQQGTQLAYVLGQSKAPLADFAAGIKNLISPVTLLSVGLTTLVAVIIQAVDWVNIGKTALNGLADILDWIVDHTGIVTTVFTAAAVPLAAYGLEVLKLGERWKAFKDIMNKIDIPKTLGNIKKSFKSLFDTIVKHPIASLLTAVGAAMVYLWSKTESGKQKLRDLAQGFRDFANSLNEPTKGLEKFDKYIDKLILKANKKSSKNGLSDIYESTYENQLAEITQRYELLTGKELEEDSQRMEQAKGLARFLAEKAVKEDEAKKATKEAAKASRDAANADKKHENAIKNVIQAYQDLSIKYQTKIDDSKFEESIRGLKQEDQLVQQIERDYQKQIEKLKIKGDRKNVDLKKLEEEKNKITKLKNAYVELELQNYKNEESMKRHDEAIEYASSLTKGLFSDMKSGLQEGQSAWEAFTNSVIKMLDKISDKMMDMAVDAMFDSLKQDKSKTSNSWLSSFMNAAINIGSSYFTGGPSGDMFATEEFASTVGIKPTIKAAKGGAFSNGVYNSPTMFAFADGGKFGVMGEAGPEAVMPLRKGPDGSLGVRADGIGGGSPVVVNVINNSNAQARTQQRQTEQGTTIDVMIDELVAQKLGQTGTASNQALTAFNNRQLIAR